MELSLLGAVNVLLAAQVAQASVVGTVADGDTGEPLRGAAVAVEGLARAAVTDARGYYVLQRVPAGTQQIDVRFIGYGHRTLSVFVPEGGQVQINIALRAEPVRLGTLEVRSLVAVGGVAVDSVATPPDQAQAVSAAGVRDHPLLAEPDVFGALASGTVLVQPESPSGLHVRGGASDQTAYLLDGFPVFSPYHAASVFSAWNPDAVARLHVSSAAPSPGYPDALSGTISAVTRSPGARLRGQGSLSTAQARVTVDGPLGVADAGYLVSLRTGFPGLIVSKREPSYIRGEAEDWLTKVEIPVGGGDLRFLAYANDDDITAAAAADEPLDPATVRNRFEWESRSSGAQWTRTFSTLTVDIRAWSARADAGSAWSAETAPVHMTATRRDAGLLATAERRTQASTTVAGVRLERSKTFYRVGPDSADTDRWHLEGKTPLAAAFLQHASTLGSRTALQVATSLTAAPDGVHLGPRAQIHWSVSSELTLSASYARTHQFVQSLRNPESVVGHVFPADLFIGSGAPDVPTAESELGVLSVSIRPRSNVRLSAEVYERSFRGLLLVAPRTREPFAVGDFEIGSGWSRGAGADAMVTGDRLEVVASYGWQRVHLTYGDSTYVPGYGTTHRSEAGLVFSPTGNWSIRLGASAALGRRATAVEGGLEWESCNLLDLGCEFAGSPRSRTDALGARTLPAYLRADLGLRRGWRREVRGRELSVSLFGTITNILARRNVLAYVTDPVTGARTDIEMRPLAPLVLGVDWRF